MFLTLWSNYLCFDGSSHQLWKTSPTQVRLEIPKQLNIGAAITSEYKKLESPLIKEKSQCWCSTRIIRQTVILFVDFVVINLNSMLRFVQRLLGLCGGGGSADGAAPPILIQSSFCLRSFFRGENKSQNT